MSFYFQDPGDPQGPYLLEYLLEACASGATTGGGLFAWTTANGLQLLFEDPAFVRFLSQGQFDLVIGIDAVTNVAAIIKLNSILETTPSLTASVFVHERPQTMFHPKVCWFAGPKSGTLISGSGNLTVAGLRGNWEAFTVTAISPSEARTIQGDWTKWRREHAEVLLSPSDPRVLEAAKTNKRWISRRPGKGPPPEEAGGVEADETAAATRDSPVLVAEIPRSDNRWKQANFDKANFEKFFGAKVGEYRRVILRHVTQDGALGAIESRKAVQVKSHNWRFELAAAGGRAYPDSKTGRPIGVFLRLPTSVILYDVLLPGDPGYSDAARILKVKWLGPANRVRRITMSAAELRSEWPLAGFWKVDEDPH